MRIDLLIALLVALFLAEDCRAENSQAEKKSVVTTIGMIADIVENIGKDLVTVESLMGPGVDPHLYKATHGDIARLSKADIIFFNGLHLEGKMVDILEKLGRKKLCIAVTRDIDPARLLHPAEFEGQADPHVWFDVELWQTAAQTVAAILIQELPKYKDALDRNSKAYQAELAALHLAVKESIASIPKTRRVLVTAHDAFGYFGRAYDIEVQGLQGISTASEFGLYDLSRVVEIVLTRGVKAVFVESSVPRKFIEALQAGVQAKGGKVEIGGELFSDAMGPKGTKEGTYTGMLRHNVDTIVKALR